MNVTGNANGERYPVIDPVADGGPRPLWSVMIPTFNCAKFLRQTLESVLAQDPGPELMQIEVVDDCSTLDDPEAVVAEVGKGRVVFTRNAANTGCCTLNFNNCIRRSRGRLVHILHGDDWVLPGFYDCIGRMWQENPDAALLATRSVFTDESGQWKSLTSALPKLKTRSRDASNFFLHTDLQCGGVVVQREFYEKEGGFMPELIHSADHEMWHRAISRGGGVVSGEVLAAYRVFDGNDTGRLMRTAENLRDRLRLMRILQSENRDFPEDLAMAKILLSARKQRNRFREIGDAEAAAANARFLAQHRGVKARLRKYLGRKREKSAG